MFAMYCGTTSGGQPLHSTVEETVLRAETILAKRLRGWSIGLVHGSYCPAPGAPITRETSLRIEVSETAEFGEQVTAYAIQLVAADLARELHQECVLVERTHAESRVVWSNADRIQLQA